MIRKTNDIVYWVCPRNVVAEGVYDSILKELNNLNVSDVSVELFLSSERVKSSHNDVKEGKSNIIVTNIDNLLSPMVSGKAVNRIFDVNMSNVVFDEFHEFVGDNALFSAFLVLLNSKTQYCLKSNVLLLSATPSIVLDLLTGNDEICYLPGKNKHYDPQHNKSYNLNFGDIPKPEKGSLHMMSSIKNVQDKYSNGYDMIIHSGYTKDDRNDKMKALYESFGKGGNKSLIVISAPILQASLDISFNSLYKVAGSPEQDIQTIGRVNRWGYDDDCTICFQNPKDKREVSAINAVYKKDLTDKWLEFLNKKAKDLNNKINLTDLYQIYNDFNEKYHNNILEFLTETLEKSLKELKTFYPKAKRNFDKTEQKFQGSTLRNAKPGKFFVVKYDNSNEWCTNVFSTNSYEGDLFKDQQNLSLFSDDSRLKKVLKNLEELGFDYGNLTKKDEKLSIKILEKQCRGDYSPVPVYKYVYCKTLGLKERKINESY